MGPVFAITSLASRMQRRRDRFLVVPVLGRYDGAMTSNLVELLDLSFFIDELCFSRSECRYSSLLLSWYLV